MAYTVKSSEKTRKPCADMETKGLLYLMNFRQDSDEIYYYIVDFFNDLTGMNQYSNKLWDLQSKAAKNNSPKSIGQELVTLFKNYLSDLTFDKYILFVGGVVDSFREDVSLSEFGKDNIKAKAYDKMRNGLIEEAYAKEYIADASITDANVDDFLSKVIFVIDDKTEEEYVKAIIKDHPNLIPEDRVLKSIFNEIRDKQSAKKNTPIVENIVIQTSDQALDYFRHLKSSEIKLLTLGRIINRNPLTSDVPLPFIGIINACPPEQQKDLLEDCQQSMCRALFNVNSAEGFWRLFEEVYGMILERPSDDVNELFRNISDDTKNGVPDLNTHSLKYFISLVKGGIQQ